VSQRWRIASAMYLPRSSIDDMVPFPIDISWPLLCCEYNVFLILVPASLPKSQAPAPPLGGVGAGAFFFLDLRSRLGVTSGMCAIRNVRQP
jgi:hypothetical protein